MYHNTDVRFFDLGSPETDRIDWFVDFCREMNDQDLYSFYIIRCYKPKDNPSGEGNYVVFFGDVHGADFAIGPTSMTEDGFIDRMGSRSGQDAAYFYRQIVDEDVSQAVKNARSG